MGHIHLQGKAVSCSPRRALQQWVCALLVCCSPLAPPVSGQTPQGQPALAAPQFLIGGALHTCTSVELHNCLPGTGFAMPADAGEVVDIDSNRNPGSTRILQAFLQASQQLSGQPEPLLALVTASSANPFDSVDFYTQMFSQLGFRVQWLPVDALLASVLDQGLPCTALEQRRSAQLEAAGQPGAYAALRAQQLDFCRDPQTGLDLLRDADAVFFNGGDQSLTLQTLVTSTGADRPWLALLRERHAAGQLVLAGTSAGTAVHSSVEMLMGGDSAAALRHGRITGDAFSPPAEDAQIDGVLFHPQGSGLFRHGILDSHFSERGRWLRLLTLLRSSSAQLAFGVDETTALVTEPLDTGGLRLRVVGEAGVVILQRHAGGYYLHYLVEGNTAVLQDGRLDFGDARPLATTDTLVRLPLDADALAQDGLRRWLAQLLQQEPLPQRAIWETGMAEVADITLDFSAFALLPTADAYRSTGFHGLALHWY